MILEKIFANVNNSLIATTGDSIVDKLQKQSSTSKEDKLSALKQLSNEVLNWLISKALSLALTALFIGICFKLVKIFLKFLKKSFEKSNMEKSVAGFFLSAIKVILYVLIFITSASLLGFQVTSFVTILGTAGVAVGLALQGSLSNLAGGVLILLLKPFKVGDYILENNTKCEGTVVAIDIFYTKLITPQNKHVVIPNGNISNTSLINYSMYPDRRVDIEFSVGYDTDVELVKKVLMEEVKKVDGFVEEKPIDVFIDSFGDSGINMNLRFFVETEKFFAGKWDMMWMLKKTFDAHDIEIPYNKLEVTVEAEENKN